MLESLSGLHKATLRSLPKVLHQKDHSQSRSLGINPKGDAQFSFDLNTHELVKKWLRKRFESGEILSEESDNPLGFGPQPPAWRFVVDPVDGSDNFERGLPLSSVSVAVLRGEGVLNVSEIEYAMVGGLDQDVPFLAKKGSGAFQGDVGLRTSSVEHLQDAFLSCELNHWNVDSSLAWLLGSARGVRSYGCASRAITLVAQGAVDAHIDIRSRLTPESFFAASLILTEAGGHICTLAGISPGPFGSLLDRTTLIAASSRTLAQEIIDVFQKGPGAN